MNALEQVTECVEAVRAEIESVRRTGPLITREEALRLGTLMRMTAPRVLECVDLLGRPEECKMRIEK